MIDGSPNTAHKLIACNRIFRRTGMQDPDEVPSPFPGFIFVALTKFFVHMKNIQVLKKRN